MPYRKEVIGDATLYLGDCLEVMADLGPVDAVVTDPPFNAGKEFANDDLLIQDWQLFCSSVAAALKVVNPENLLIEIGKNDKEMRAALDEIFHYRWALVLNYTNSMRQGAVGFSNFGLVFWYGGKCYERFMDRIDSPLENTLQEFNHPSPKNEKHYSRLVRMFSEPGAVILDPFMGSGTTGVACAKLGRKFLGIEIEPKYFDIACMRIAKATGDFKSLPKAKKTGFFY